MNEGEFAQNLQKLKPGLRGRFYERLSSLCYSKLRQNCLSVSHKVVFLFLLSLCAEITLCLNAPVFRSMRINFPPAIILNTTGYNTKPLLFQQNPVYRNGTRFLSALPASILGSVGLYHTDILYNHDIPISLPIAVFIIFISFTILLIRDDRIIASTRIKLSPITAQGPPFLECFFTIGASRIRTPYLCRKRMDLSLQKVLCPEHVSNKTNHNNYQNLFLCFLQDPLVSRASRIGENRILALLYTRRCPVKKGFTLMELIVVVIIIGILAMIGLPQFFSVAERGRAAEAFSVLGSVRSAQLRYASERSDNTTADDITHIDVSIPTLKYFSAPDPDPVDVGTATNVVATIARKDGPTYSLGIQVGGNITCASGSCPKLPQ